MVLCLCYELAFLVFHILLLLRLKLSSNKMFIFDMFLPTFKNYLTTINMITYLLHGFDVCVFVQMQYFVV